MSIFAIFALVFGGIALVSGLLLIFRNKEFCSIAADLSSSPSQLFEWGLMALVLGLVVIGHEYRLALSGWYWIIPLLGWLSILKGLWIIFFPQSARGAIKTYCPPGSTTAFYGFVSSLIGLGLIWLAFTAY